MVCRMLDGGFFMKKAAILGERRAGLIETEIPQPPAGWALVKVHVAPMCAEYKGFVQGQESHCLGHEAAGEVVEVNQAGRLKVGDRVVAMPLLSCGECPLCLSGEFIHCHDSLKVKDSTMSQYIIKPAFMLQKIPDHISYERASLACCGLGASFGAMERMGVTAFETILITGLGPVGLGAVINARYRGARVIAVESNEQRAKKARDFGVETVIDPRDPEAVQQIIEWSGGLGPDCAVECSGAVAAHRLCIDAVRRKGRIAFVGESHTETPIIISNDLIRKGLQLMGSWHYNLNDFPKLLRVIEHSPFIDSFVTHVFPMSRIQEAFEMSASQGGGKILLKPWE